MGSKSSLGDRMKRYEQVPRTSLTPRTPMIIRIDGRAFHTYTKNMQKPWDPVLRDALTAAAQELLREIAGAKLAYLQSDEISVLVTDYDKLTSQAWFDKVAQKICSVSASITTAVFNRGVLETFLGRYDVRELKGADGSLDTAMLPPPAHFDSRCFVVPREDVTNYLVWRQQDSTRNSVSALAQSHFSHEELQGKKWGQMQELLFQEKEINWNDCETWQKRGWCVLRSTVEIEPGKMRVIVEPDLEVPVFSNYRAYIEKYLHLDTDA